MSRRARDPGDAGRGAPSTVPGEGLSGASGDGAAVGSGLPGLSAVEPADLRAWMTQAGQPAYRAAQVFDGLWGGRAASLADVRTLPAALRDRLDAAFAFDTLVATEIREAEDGRTERALHLLGDGASIESVLMHYAAHGERRERNTLCISSQAGCAVGCPFCATGELGLTRDLDTAEIVDQVRAATRRLVARGRRLTNVVFMGMGEPFLNLDRVLAAAAILTDPARIGLGARHVTLSTSGVVPGIRRLTRMAPQYTLAVSLHAARDPLRDVLVPLNRRWPVAQVVAAATEYQVATGRRVSYEYVMIDGVNDTAADLAALGDLLRGRRAHVNLIPMNDVAHTPWRATPADRVEAFAAGLRSVGIGSTVRRNRGREVGAACGQLAAERAGEPPAPTVARRRALLVEESARALRGERSDAPRGIERP
jgi:23S rRNA (adenine2503-C2)-methyltransferase